MESNRRNRNVDDNVNEDEDDLFPKSEFFIRGSQMVARGQSMSDTRFLDEVTALVRRGSESGCVRSMNLYSYILLCDLNRIDLALPWLLESAIRGHKNCLSKLASDCYLVVERPRGPYLLADYWMKLYNKWGDYDPEDMQTNKEQLKDSKKYVGKLCIVCCKKDSETITLQRCGMCQFYYYCSKECQSKHWNEFNHMGECKQLKILKKYHKPYAKSIREASHRGDNLREIPALQKLRTKLGLTRPKEEYIETPRRGGETYKETLRRVGDIFARKDGTVYMGSTPETI